MHKSRFSLPISFLSLAAGITGILTVVYIGLIAVVMSYAALTIEFSQSVKTDEAAVAQLESQYLAGIAEITNTDPTARGYVTPVAKTFVPSSSPTALR